MSSVLPKCNPQKFARRATMSRATKIQEKRRQIIIAVYPQAPFGAATVSPCRVEFLPKLAELSRDLAALLGALCLLALSGFYFISFLCASAPSMRRKRLSRFFW